MPTLVFSSNAGKNVNVATATVARATAANPYNLPVITADATVSSPRFTINQMDSGNPTVVDDTTITPYIAKNGSGDSRNVLFNIPDAHISRILTDATASGSISSATLRIAVQTASSTSTALGAYETTQATVPAQLTYNEYATGSNWVGGGANGVGDYNATALDELTIAQGVLDAITANTDDNHDLWPIIELDITSYLSDIVFNSASNNGVLIRPTAASPNYEAVTLTNDIAGIDGWGGQQGCAPELIVVYSTTAAATAPVVVNPNPDRNAALDASVGSVDIVTGVFTDDNPMSYSVTGLPPGLSMDGSGIVTGTPNTTTGSPFTVTLTATDDTDSLSTDDVFLWSVNGGAGNSAPTQDSAIPNQSDVVGVGTPTLDLADHFTDPDDDPISYTATSALPNGVSLNVNGQFEGTFNAPFNGTINLEVQDSFGDSVLTPSFDWVVSAASETFTFTTQALENNTNSGSVLANTEVHWSFFEGGRIGSLSTPTQQGTNTTNSSGVLEGTLTSDQQGILLMAVHNTGSSDDAVCYQVVTGV